MIFLAIAILFFCASPTLASTCYGDDPCHACHTCEYCRNCNSGGHPCGILTGSRGHIAYPVTAKTKVHHASTSAFILPPSLRPQRRSSLSTVSNQKSRLSSFRRPLDITSDPIPAPLQSLPEPSPLPSGRPGRPSVPTTQQNQGYNPASDLPLLSSPPLMVSGPPRVWQLSVTPMALNGMTESLVGFHYWTDMQPETKIMDWDRWATRLMHTIYSSLRTQHSSETSGRFESFVIYIRSDQKIMLKSDSGNGSVNIAQLRSSVEQLNGSADLVFPHPVRDDTVFISGMIGYAPEPVAGDVWGRPEVKEVTNWNRRTW